MEDQLKIAKTVTKFVAVCSARFVVAQALINLIPTETKIKKIELYIGASVIGSLVADKAAVWASQNFDDFVESIKKFNTIVEETNK
jgi:hypothetical protein